MRLEELYKMAYLVFQIWIGHLIRQGPFILRKTTVIIVVGVVVEEGGGGGGR